MHLCREITSFTLRDVSVRHNVKAHWPGAAASDGPTATKLNRLLPVQCSEKFGSITTQQGKRI